MPCLAISITQLVSCGEGEGADSFSSITSLIRLFSIGSESVLKDFNGGSKFQICVIIRCSKGRSGQTDCSIWKLESTALLFLAWLTEACSPHTTSIVRCLTSSYCTLEECDTVILKIPEV